MDLSALLMLAWGILTGYWFGRAHAYFLEARRTSQPKTKRRSTDKERKQ